MRQLLSLFELTKRAQGPGQYTFFVPHLSLPWYQLGFFSIGEDLLPVCLPSSLHNTLSKRPMLLKRERRQKTYQCFRRCFASKENESTRSTWQAISIPLVLVHLDPSIAFDFDGFVEFLMGRNKTSLIFFFPIRSRETKLSRDATFFIPACFVHRKKKKH